jgi:hypothetical protein
VSAARSPEEDHQVRLWNAYERLDDAYLLHDEDAIRREQRLIADLREQAAAARIPKASLAPSLRERVADMLGRVAQRLVVFPLELVVVRSTSASSTQQGKADVPDDARSVLGSAKVTAVVNGSELGIAVADIDVAVEDRLLLFAESEDHVVDATLVPAAPGAGFASVTVPWTADLPTELIIVVLPEGLEASPPPPP